MADYIEKLLDDLPQQYKGKTRIEALFSVIGQQLQDVYDFYEELKSERFIDTAYGITLDYIGDIVGITRREAQEILGESETLSDDTYRRMLIYKISLNFGDGTFASILNCIKLLLGSTLGFVLKEEYDVPATVILETDEAPSSENVQAIISIPIPRAAGVGLLIRTYDGADCEVVLGIVSHIFEELPNETSDEVDVDEDYVVLTDENDVMYTDESLNLLLYS